MPTSSDTDRQKNEGEILREQMRDSLYEYKRNNFTLLLSSVAAGLEIGFSFLLMAALFTQYYDNVSSYTLHLIIALSYPIGFILVVIGRTDLFTEHTTLAILPVLDGRRKLRGLMRVWGLIYIGNMVGALLFASLFVQFSEVTVNVDKTAIAYYSEKLIADGNLGLFLGAVYAGWLMGLLAWVVSSASDTISRIAVITLITFVIGFGGLAHCIAGAVAMYAAWISDAADVSTTQLLNFLALATLGNTIGGSVFVGLIKYSYISKKG
ncbi:formate/nitrite transporter family protein [Microbulbifer yueqingensis]|uniref:Formate/nitrite transporter FocA, FNT family n=1 Tax=Microbulbifer yueqingensis TaxID=658219 RepID=A0A1G9BRE4_9GAMM|nr:formate/nitrite transporter family protein [Microbulbifer yueqingensis]SDK42038.1 Formate/nitrite transporter FocA, FNT family [Microbulbifer yueqingensis]